MLIADQLTLKWSRYIPHKPAGKQLAFLLLDCPEALYGGAAGGGKTDALLMAALQYVDVPGYSAILFRRTYADLSLPGALIPRAHEWLQPTDARWNDMTKTWVFPSGATVSFGYLEHALDHYRYQGMEIQFCGWDELTQMDEAQYRYLFSRLRRLEGADVPLRMRAASNPGGVGHEWVKRRFLDEGKEYGRVFIPARLDDNPFLDRVEYIRSLSELDPITRAQLLDGDWSARQAGGLFRREWFPVVEDYPHEARRLRYWDLAATVPKEGSDPDHTVGNLVAVHGGVWYVLDMQRLRASPAAVEARIRQTATQDGKSVSVRMEQEPGASGVNTIDHYRRGVLLGYDFRGVRSTGSKIERARPVSAAAEAGNIRLVRGSWLGAFLDELEAFPDGAHDDIVDSLSGAMSELLHHREGRTEMVLAGSQRVKPEDNPLNLPLNDSRYWDRDTADRR